MALTARQVTKLTEPGRYGDGGGLYLNVSQSGSKSWVFIWAKEHRKREMGLDREISKADRKTVTKLLGGNGR